MMDAALFLTVGSRENAALGHLLLTTVTNWGYQKNHSAEEGRCSQIWTGNEHCGWKA